MPVLALAAITSLTLAAAPPPPRAPCKADPLTPTVSRGPPEPRKLGDLPDGHLMRTVLRSIEGCDVMEVRVAGVWELKRTGSRLQPTPAAPDR